ANEGPDAIAKGVAIAKKRLVKVPLAGTTIPFEVTGRYGSTRILLKPASPGTGVIAGSVVRSVLERLGVKDILTKCYGSRNPHNLLAAMFRGLLELETPEEIGFARGKTLEELQYQVFGG
ncbi:MAG: 30S ribosomal protein S5, partial [Deltaproteobacteria bacterium]|nr:30S ribosomal protein S5 [Deltaproteobacteria bacterium]